MKQMKIVIMAVCAILVGVSFTSCNNDSGNKLYYPAYVTVNSGSSGVTLTADYNHTLTPTNPGALLNSANGKYLERAYVYYEYANDNEYVDGKTNYDVTLLNVNDIGGRAFCNRDTITLDPTELYIDKLHSAWGGAGGYITVGFDYFYSSNIKTMIENFDMFLYEEFTDEKIPVYQGKLYVAFLHNQKIENPVGSGTVPVSFKMPLKKDLEKFSDLEFYNGDGYGNDSIDVVVVTQTKNDGQKALDPIRVRVY